MITTDDALELARKYVGNDDEIDISLEDFGPVCVINFSHKPKRKPATPKPAPPPISDPEIPPWLEPADDEIDDDIGLIGFGPILIDKRNSKIFGTGGTDVLYDSEYYVQSYLSCGDPDGKPTSILDISDFSKNHNKRDAIKLIHVECQIGMQEAKTIIDRVIEGDSVELETRDPDSAIRLAKKLQQLGVVAVQRWVSNYHLEIPKMSSSNEVPEEEKQDVFDSLEDYFSDQEDEK